MYQKQITLIILFFFSALLLQAQDVKMKPVFNGKNLKGWIVPENNIWWKAENGILSVENGPNKKGSILWTKKSYQNFVIEVDFKMGKGTIDSGIFMRSDKKPHPQVQIGISGSLKRDMTCSPYVPGKGYPKEADVKGNLKMDDWNTLRVQVIGHDYTFWLNGKEVMTYTAEGEGLLSEGPIGLQLHGNTEMAIEFRNLKVGKIKG